MILIAFKQYSNNTNNDEGREGKVKKCCFKAFKAITVAAARGLFGAVNIRRKDDKNPPCLKIHGKLYEANIHYCTMF